MKFIDQNKYKKLFHILKTPVPGRWEYYSSDTLLGNLGKLMAQEQKSTCATTVVH